LEAHRGREAGAEFDLRYQSGRDPGQGAIPHRAVGVDDAGHAVGRRHHDRPGELGCASTSDLELLLWL